MIQKKKKCIAFRLSNKNHGAVPCPAPAMQGRLCLQHSVAFMEIILGTMEENGVKASERKKNKKKK